MSIAISFKHDIKRHWSPSLGGILPPTQCSGYVHGYTAPLSPFHIHVMRQFLTLDLYIHMHVYLCTVSESYVTIYYVLYYCTCTCIESSFVYLFLHHVWFYVRTCVHTVVGKTYVRWNHLPYAHAHKEHLPPLILNSHLPGVVGCIL